jgi:hypothetical protein
MTTKPAEEVLEAYRAELKAVLASKYFLRAPKLAHLLFYLCERLFVGEADQIKEYSIGVEVFHRGPEFDQESDSIVRVEANRLRRQLAEFYANEGARHPLRLTIPVGQYVPAFEPHAVAALPAKRPRFFLPGRPLWWLAGALVLIFAGVGASFLLQHRHRAASALPAPLASSPEAAPIGPPAGDEVRILAGSNRSQVDHAGKLWQADTWFTGGTATKNAATHIARTQDAGFYRTSRQGQFRYRIPLKPGLYELHLYFAETVYGLDAGGEGSRIFTVRAGGRALLDRFDLVADAGASRTADVKVFTDIAPAADGYLTLEFAGEAGQRATLSGIEILPGLRGQMRPVRLLPRPTPYYSNDSHWWSPDNFFEGGQMASYAAPVAGVGDPELYESERWGNFSYAIPVAPGKYSLLLHFAARSGAWNQAFAADAEHPPVAHRFNVFCNGSELLKNFDLAREARPDQALVRRCAHLEPNAQGKLLLQFVPVAGYATVTGIEVLPE